MNSGIRKAKRVGKSELTIFTYEKFQENLKRNIKRD